MSCLERWGGVSVCMHKRVCVFGGGDGGCGCFGCMCICVGCEFVVCLAVYI